MISNLNYQKAILSEIRKKAAGKSLEQSTLRLEVPFSKANTYIFPLLDSDQRSAAKTERRLKAGERFVPFAVGLKHYVRATNVADSEVYAKLNTYVDKGVYAAATGFNADHLQAIYNADLTVTRRKELVIPQLYTDVFEAVPETQTATGIVRQLNADSAFVNILDTKVIEGNGQNEIRFEAIPANYDWQYPAAENKEVRLVLLLRGFKIV